MRDIWLVGPLARSSLTIFCNRNLLHLELAALDRPLGQPVSSTVHLSAILIQRVCLRDTQSRWNGVLRPTAQAVCKQRIVDLTLLLNDSTPGMSM